MMLIKKYDGSLSLLTQFHILKLQKKSINWRQILFVEKPLTLSYSSSTKLCDLAAKKIDVSLWWGMFCLFHPAFLKMKNIINSGRIGEINTFIVIVSI